MTKVSVRAGEGQLSNSVANLAPPFYAKIRANQEAKQLMTAEQD